MTNATHQCHTCQLHSDVHVSVYLFRHISSMTFSLQTSACFLFFFIYFEQICLNQLETAKHMSLYVTHLETTATRVVINYFAPLL